MKDIYSKLIEIVERGQPLVLATIIKQAGPSPRGMGAKCLIRKDGSLVGTIGGGLLEAQTLQEAKKAFDTPLPLRLSFVLKGTDVAGTDMLCGGDVDIFLEPILPSHLAVFQTAMSALNAGDAGLLATAVTPNRWQAGVASRIFLRKDGESAGALADIDNLEERLREKMDDLLLSKQPRLLAFEDRTGNPVEIFVEPVVSEPVLYVFGGGHVSKEIVPLAARVGFKVVVIDDRQEFVDMRDFPDAEVAYHLPFEGVMDRLPVSGSSYLIIVTRGHMHDMTVLAQSLRTPARYIGMIGSRRKRNMIYEALLQKGFTHADLDQVHAPIGLDIGAETPAEIAVSIVAELIKVRAGNP